MVVPKPDAMTPVTVTCPHCGVECHPMMWPDDAAFIVCGYCGKVMEVFRKDGETVKVEKA